MPGPHNKTDVREEQEKLSGSKPGLHALEEALAQGCEQRDAVGRCLPLAMPGCGCAVLPRVASAPAAFGVFDSITPPLHHSTTPDAARYNFGDRARNPAGQYASGYDVSSDDMATAYGAKKKKAAMIVGAGGATVAAALAGKKYAPQIGRSMGPAIGRVLRNAIA